MRGVQFAGSALGELVEPAVVGGAVWPPPNKARRRPEPAARIEKREGHLTDGRRWHRAPGRHRRMLPARLNRVLFWPGLGKHLVELRRHHMFGRARDSEVVQSTVRMTKAEHQRGLRTIAGDADDGTVGCTLPFHFHPLALARQISTVAALGDDALKTGHEGQPFLGVRDARRLSDELDVRAWLFEQCFEATSPFAQRLMEKIAASIPHEIKGKQDGG